MSSVFAQHRRGWAGKCSEPYPVNSVIGGTKQLDENSGGPGDEEQPQGVGGQSRVCADRRCTNNSLLTAVSGKVFLGLWELL